MTRILLAAIALAGLGHAAGAQPTADAITRMRACLRAEGAARQRAPGDSPGAR
jgi:hypothetical protein